MATNQFKPFATGVGANVTSQADWEALPSLLTGFTAGKASSDQVNKAIRQASFIAAAIAQFVSDKANVDVLDDGGISSFVTKLTSALAKQSLSRANPFGDIKSDGDEAVRIALGNLDLIVTSVGKSIISSPTIADLLSYLGVTDAINGKQPLSKKLTSISNLTGAANKLAYFSGADDFTVTDLTAYARGLIGAPSATDARSYLTLKSAALRDIGTAQNQVPDMSYWTGGGNTTTGWRKTPDGYIEQWGLTGATTTDVFINFPIPFPTAVISINEHDVSAASESMSMWQFQSVANANCLAQNMGVLTRGSTTFNSPVASGCRWFAKGK